MFDGDGFGVGLTVTPLADPALIEGGRPVGAGWRPSRLTDLLPPDGRSRTGKAVELGRVRAMQARLQAYEAALVVSLAAESPDLDDRPAGAPGAASPDWPGVEHPAAGVSEFFVDELAAALGTSPTAAGAVWALDTTLHDRLPGTWAALADGELDWPRGRAITAEFTGRGVEPIVCMAVEAAVLPVAAELTVPRLKALVRAELVAHDAAYAERRRRAAERHADARVRPDPAVAGRAVLEADLSVEDAHACWALADSLARAAKAAGDPRPVGLLRAEAIRDRVLGVPDEEGMPRIAADVTVIASLDALERAAVETPENRLGRPEPPPDEAVGAAAVEPGGDAAGTGAGLGPADPTGRRTPVGEVCGRPITARHLRVLLESVDALCPGGLQAPTGGTLRYALTDPDGALRAVVTDRQLRRLARRGCSDHGGGEDCGCGLVDRPRDVDRYRPGADQYSFVRTRDRGCRMPGCTARAAWADLDHVIPHACGGATSCDNLCSLCRRHHRLTTFARGWSTRMAPDGTVTVTTPTGITRTSRPPGMIAASAARAARAATGVRAGPAPPHRGHPVDVPPF